VTSLAEATAFCRAHGLPVLVKAAHGGGGRGMRVVRVMADLAEALAAAAREAEAAFGNGAVFLYAGDRATLSDSGHTLVNTSLSYSNRYMYCYVPMVALADCGNAVRDCEQYGGPHQGVFISGNNHRLLNSQLHDLVEAASDSGTVCEFEARAAATALRRAASRATR
jgi:hypothetical protein